MGAPRMYKKGERKHSPRSSQLVPAAARTTAGLSRAENALSEKAIETFVNVLGGRQKLIDLLAAASDEPEVDNILQLIDDPLNDGFTVQRLCALAGYTPLNLFSALKKAAVARAHIEAILTQITPKLSKVVADVMDRAQPHEVRCTACKGLGVIPPRPTTDDPNPSPKPCEPCGATGKVEVLPDLDRQKLALELGQLIVKGGGIAIQMNQLNASTGSVSASTPGALEQLQQAVDEILFKTPPPALPPAEEEPESEAPQAAVEGEVIHPAEE